MRMLYGGAYDGFGMGLLMVLCIAAVYVVFLVAAWRAMRAHELLAKSVTDLTDSLKYKKEP